MHAAKAAPASMPAPRPAVDIASMTSDELLAAITQVGISDVEAVMQEAGRRKLAAAVPALAEVIRRFTGFAAARPSARAGRRPGRSGGDWRSGSGCCGCTHYRAAGSPRSDLGDSSMGGGSIGRHPADDHGHGLAAARRPSHPCRRLPLRASKPGGDQRPDRATGRSQCWCTRCCSLRAGTYGPC